MSFDEQYISVVTRGYACIGRMRKINDNIYVVRDEDLELSLQQYIFYRAEPILQIVLEESDGHSLRFLTTRVTDDDLRGDSWREHIEITNECTYVGVAAWYEIAYARSRCRRCIRTICNGNMSV